MALSGNQVTRLSPAGIAMGQYGSFAGKAEQAVIFPPTQRTIAVASQGRAFTVPSRGGIIIPNQIRSFDVTS